MYQEQLRIEILRRRFPEGTKIRLELMVDEPQMPPGLKGEVLAVDDAGQILVKWENGSALSLQPRRDSFYKISGPKRETVDKEVFR